jgi:2-polyprenyl-3-methyl-5-hydroxy-6-metoxy-1,4-benzoquinol methylase
MFLESRQREAEWLDEPGADPVALHKSLAFIRRVNRALGYTRVILDHLDRFSAKWKPGEKIRIVDVGTGSADIPLAILKWAGRRGFDVQVVGVDLHANIVREAAAAANDPRLSIVRGDALDLPFNDESFDYALSSMFLHHLDDGDARQAMSELGRVSRRGVIISDLLRKKHAYAFIWLMTIFSIPMVRHDARVSVAQAFNTSEILALRDAAGLSFAKYFSHMRHRLVLAGEKPGAK